MSIDHCIDNALAGGDISRSDADWLKRRYAAAMEAQANGGRANAAEQARLDLFESIAADSAEQRRRAKLALANIRKLDAELVSHRTAGGRQDIAAAAYDKMEHFGTAGFSSVAGRRRAIIGMAHGKMADLLHHFRRGAVGGDLARHNKADLNKVLAESFGHDTGDVAARAFANAWMKTADWLRKKFNAAGGAIGKLENWGLPQRHDARALRKATLPVWKAYIRPLLDVGRMRHPLTGKPVSEREIDGVLDEVYYSVTSEGLRDLEPVRRPFGLGALATRRAEHRFLVFKDPDSWLAYQNEFGGGGDIFAAMMEHIGSLAGDIAAMEELGPNPGGTVEWMIQSIHKEAGEIAAGRKGRLGNVTPARAMDKARRAEERIRALWSSIRGELNTPVDSRWANIFASGRLLITAGSLGSAALSAISDLGFQRAARAFAFGDKSIAGPLAGIIDGFRSSTRQEAVGSMLILDEAMNTFHAQARYVGTLAGPRWAEYLVDRVLTFSGLTPWTQAGKHAFGLASFMEFGKQAARSWSELPDFHRDLLSRYGFRDKDWEVMRKAPLHGGGKGAALLRPNEIAERVDEKLALRYLEMVLQETEYAVPSSTHRTRTLLIDQNRPGTIWGEVMRSFAQFKSFGAAALFLHGMRTHNMIAAGHGASGAAYAGSLLLTTTLLGALAVQLKQVSGGRDPRDMTGPAFWGAAALQGGGLGIYGDFLFADINRFGGGFATTLGGPLTGKVNDFWNLTAGNAVQLASDDKTHFGRELTRFSRGLVPGGNIWYLRLAYERTFLDQLQYLMDPEANAAFKRRQRYWQREYGQGHWWAPGTSPLPLRSSKAGFGPQRGPDLGAAFGG